MSAVVARAWEAAVDRGTPTLVTFGGAMAAVGLQRIGFCVVGRVWHLVDRIDRCAGLGLELGEGWRPWSSQRLTALIPAVTNPTDVGDQP